MIIYAVRVSNNKRENMLLQCSTTTIIKDWMVAYFDCRATDKIFWQPKVIKFTMI